MGLEGRLPIHVGNVANEGRLNESKQEKRGLLILGGIHGVHFSGLDPGQSIREVATRLLNEDGTTKEITYLTEIHRVH